MAPTVIVGADENASDVARELLGHADNQRQVRVRTDLPATAYEVDEATYKRYVGRRRRDDDEQRINQFDEQVREATAEDSVTSGDEVPREALNVEPGTGDDITGIQSGDEVPREARNVEPPSNGDAPNDGTGFEQAVEPNADPDAQRGGEPEPAPKPRKRTAAKRAAAKTTPSADSGAGK